MSNKVTLYHNPNCSKSRAVLALLKERNLNVDIVLYLENPPTIEALKLLLQQLDITAHELMRVNEAEYKTQQLANRELSETQLIEAMITTPKLIERPIVQFNGKAAIGRPPENVLAIL